MKATSAQAARASPGCSGKYRRASRSVIHARSAVKAAMVASAPILPPTR